jgi:hypothetical protein
MAQVTDLKAQYPPKGRKKKESHVCSQKMLGNAALFGFQPKESRRIHPRSRADSGSSLENFHHPSPAAGWVSVTPCIPSQLGEGSMTSPLRPWWPCPSPTGHWPGVKGPALALVWGQRFWADNGLCSDPMHTCFGSPALPNLDFGSLVVYHLLFWRLIVIMVEYIKC